MRPIEEPTRRYLFGEALILKKLISVLEKKLPLKSKPQDQHRVAIAQDFWPLKTKRYLKNIFLLHLIRLRPLTMVSRAYIGRTLLRSYGAIKLSNSKQECISSRAYRDPYYSVSCSHDHLYISPRK